jgi:FtsH-binding integral membrane protein
VRALPTDTIAPAGGERVYFRRVFAWMAAGLAVTGGVSAWIGSSNRALYVLFQGNGRAVVVVCSLVELLLVWSLASLVQRMDLYEAAATFLAYAALNGVTISIIFAVFTTKSIFVSFFVTAAMFGALAAWGYTTGADLTTWGSFLFMALIGQLIGIVVNLFWLNDVLYWATTATGVLLFSAFTAYDVQRLKRYDTGGDPSSPAVEKQAIVGALALYLDFINLFLYILRIMGRRK